MDACFASDHTLEKLPQASQVGATRVGGIDLNKLRVRCVAEAVLALSPSPAGFTGSDLAREIRILSGQPESEYGPRRAAYDSKKLRAKGMVRKIGTSRRYEPVPEGLRAMTALVVLATRSSGHYLPPILNRGRHPHSHIHAHRPLLRKPPRGHARPVHCTRRGCLKIGNLFFMPSE
jgi:hypothetical protein